MPNTGGDDWEDVEPWQKLQYEYDFSDRLAPGDTISTVAWSLDLAPMTGYRATDGNPAGHISNTSHDGTTATCWLDTLVAHARYALVAKITTANGSKDDLWAYVKCNPTP
jgi:hypothetical protein